MKIINKQPIAFIKNLTKAYTEGVYADTPQNRKLGRVGMTYAAYAEKSKKDSSDKKTWDKIEAFYKKGSDENKLWQVWYKLQKTGDHSWMGVFRDILAQKFSNVNKWTQTTPNTGKQIITAKNKDGEVIASIDLSGDEINLPTLQTFMDKCYIGKTEEEALADYVPEEKVTLSSFKDSRKRDMVKKALKEAKSSNKPFFVGINDDGEGYFIDDAIDYFPDLNKDRVIATCFPNGDIKRGFVEIENYKI